MARTLVLNQFLPYRLSVASNAVLAQFSNAYRKYGLKIAEWRLIAILAERQRATPAALSDATRMDKIMVSRAARGLMERGLITIDANPNDRRSHFHSLTDAGRTLHAEVAPIALAEEARLFACFTPSERETLRELLQRIEASAEES